MTAPADSSVPPKIVSIDCSYFVFSFISFPIIIVNYNYQKGYKNEGLFSFYNNLSKN